jgi:hypothetical protein
LTSLRSALVWGYGHYVVFAAAGAVGGGLAVAMDHAAHKSHLRDIAAGYPVALPVDLFLLIAWLLQVRPHQRRPRVLAYPGRGGARAGRAVRAGSGRGRGGRAGAARGVHGSDAGTPTQRFFMSRGTRPEQGERLGRDAVPSARQTPRRGVLSYVSV